MTATTTESTQFTYPADEPIVVITRTFDAPRELVWRAFTEPAHLVHWWGPASHASEVVEMDLRPGGRWRIVSRTPDGSVFAFRGEYREVVSPERLVQTFAMEGPYEDRPAIETAVFEERDGRTHFRGESRFMGFEDRNGMVAAGMEGGARESYDRLARLLETLAAQPA